MIYVVSFYHLLFRTTYDAITDNELMAKEFIRQIESHKSAVTLGKFVGLNTSNANLSNKECDDILRTSTSTQRIKTFKSELDPNIQILGTDYLMMFYEDKIYADLYTTIHKVANMRPLFEMVRESCFPSFGMRQLSDLILLVISAFSNNQIDLVKLSLNIPFHIGSKTDPFNGRF